MKIMYRGCRLGKFTTPENIKKNGMSYYWSNAESAIEDIFRALEYFHKISVLGKSPHLRRLLLGGSRTSRLQVWATDDKDNANSYARATPELIFLVLDAVGIDRARIRKYFDSFYGKPYIVTFRLDDSTYCGINTPCGKIISAEDIIDIESVDVTKPDPYFERLKSKSMDRGQEIVLTAKENRLE